MRAGRREVARSNLVKLISLRLVPISAAFTNISVPRHYMEADLNGDYKLVLA